MPCESGAEGKIRITAASPPAVDTEFKVYNWVLESDPNLQECTNATTSGVATMSSVKDSYKVVFDCYISSAMQPEEVGLTEGREVELRLRVGRLLSYNNWAFTLGAISLKGCDANGLASYNVTAHSNVAKPALDTYDPP